MITRLVTCTALAATAAPGLATEISYNLNWYPQGEHCGFFQAAAER
jgi:ABC-type nitrate/sulfonate/bicarbonate transport system substrate-binding protein